MKVTAEITGQSPCRRREDRKIRLRQPRRVCRRIDARREVALAGDGQASFAKRRRVLLASGQHGDLHASGEVGGVEAADHAPADHADALDRHAPNLTR
jgi:hypothetical protein